MMLFCLLVAFISILALQSLLKFISMLASFDTKILGNLVASILILSLELVEGLHKLF